MNDVQIFTNKDFGDIRTIEEDGKIIFCATDVATALGYVNPQKAVKDHCKKDGVTNRSVIDSLGREQRAKFIDEGNLYRLVTHSKLPAAEKFERWVFDAVLPTIRKTGQYIMRPYDTKPTSIGEVVNLVKEFRLQMSRLGYHARDIFDVTIELCEQFNIKVPEKLKKPVLPGQMSFDDSSKEKILT